MTRKSWGEKDLFGFYSIVLFITEGKQDRNSVRAESWRQELTDADAMERLCLLTSSHGLLSLLSYRQKDCLLWGGTTHNGMVPPPSITD